MRLKAISLFTGVGGLDFGFEAAGFETRVALDNDPVCCRAIQKNRSWPVIKRNVAEIESREILDTATLRPGDADVLIGGPPCQPFSKSGYWANGDSDRLNDPRSQTLTQYFRVLRDTQPKSFLLENVPGLNYRGKSEGIKVIEREIENINVITGARYAFVVQTLNAANYGVPQLRERVFVIGAREGTLLRFPDPTHVAVEDCVQNDQLEPYRTAWDALGDLPGEPNDGDLSLTGKWADLLPTIPEGRNYLWHTERGGGEPLFGWRRRYWNFLLKLSKNLPSWTIQAQPGPATGPFHWRNRKLSATEMSRIQTFPDGIDFDCRRSDAQRLIGNAVPSALAEVLAREIATQILGAPRQAEKLTLLPARREDLPDPEPSAPLPRKYKSLIGCHDAHPGTGLGRRAVGRSDTLT